MPRATITAMKTNCAGRPVIPAFDGLWRAQGKAHAGVLWLTEASIPRRAIGVLVRALEAVARDRASLQGICIAPPRPPE